MDKELTIEIMYGLSDSGKSELARGIVLAYRGLPDTIFGIQRPKYSDHFSIDNAWNKNYILDLKLSVIDEPISTNRQLLEVLGIFISKLNRHINWNLNLIVHYFNEDREACAFNKGCGLEDLGEYELPNLELIKEFLGGLTLNEYNIQLLNYEVKRKPDWVHKAQGLLDKHKRELEDNSNLKYINIDIRNPYLCSSEWSVSYNEYAPYCEEVERFDELVELLTIVAPELSMKEYSKINQMVESIQEEEKYYDSSPTVSNYWRISLERLINYLYYEES